MSHQQRPESTRTATRPSRAPRRLHLGTLGLVIAVAVGACSEQPGAPGASGAPDALSGLDAIFPSLLQDIGAAEGSQGTLATKEGALGTPAAKFESPPLSNNFKKLPGVPLDIPAIISVTDFSMPADGHVQWYLDGTMKSEGSSTSYTYADVPTGIHKLGVVLVDTTGKPVGGASGTVGLLLKVTNDCTTTADCKANNVCWESACISGDCKYGPIGIADCCASMFDCNYPDLCAPDGDNKDRCVECTGDADCDDGNTCTYDTCSADGTCIHDKDSTSCCNEDGDCHDGDPCTTNTCDTVAETCNAPVEIEGCCTTVDDCDLSDPCKTVACIGQICRYGAKNGCCTQDTDCDDKNICTVNTCNVADNTCDYSVKTSTSCCVKDSDCDDGKPETLDQCVANNCSHPPNELYCVTVADCTGGNLCTTPSCAANLCSYDPIPGCCLVDADCADNNACTTNTCNVATHTCSSAPVVGCCNSDAQCDDSDFCTIDKCIGLLCRHGPDATKPLCCTSDAGCNDKNGCTLDKCTDNVCSYPPDPTKLSCCTSSATCDDGNVCTNDACINNECVHTQSSGGCCTDDSECDDGMACTIDICDPVGHSCQNPKLQGACCSDADCAPQDKCHTATCNVGTTKCVQIPVAGTDCCDTAADCPTPTNPCEVATCTDASAGVKGVCHTVPKTDCCTTNSQCQDSNSCTDNVCNPTTHECEFPDKEGVDPETCKACVYHAECDDLVTCTYDYCIANSCVHIDKANCCDTEADCDDGNDCNVDKCIYHRCKHFPAGTTPGMQSPAECCADDSDCKDDGNACTTEVCDPAEGVCITEPTPSCERTLPYNEPFDSVPDNNPANVGFTFAGAGNTHWQLSNIGPLGSDPTLRFWWFPQDTNVEGCAVTPYVNTGTAGKLQIGWTSYFKYNNGSSPVQLRVEIAANGDWAGGETLWSKTVSGDLPVTPLQFERSTPYTGGKLVQLRFCAKTANTYGMDYWSVDDVFIVSGTPPVFVTNPTTQVVTVGQTKLTALKATDGDLDPLTFELVGAPDFVTLGSQYFYAPDKSWNVVVKSAPPSDPKLAGTYPIKIRTSDGVLTAETGFNLIVKYEGGYLVWSPPGVNEDAANAIRDALHDLDKEAQIQQYLLYYSDLTVFEAVFVTLGVYPDNYALTLGDSFKLEKYLNKNGRLYIEGGDAWEADPATNVRAMFKVVATEDGNTADGPLVGHNMLDGKQWSYAQSPALNSQIDRISAEIFPGTATILRNQGNQTYGVVVAHDDAEGFRTIASSVLFAGIGQVGQWTDLTLLAAYLDLFENGLPGCFSNDDCVDGNPCTTDVCNTAQECVYESNTAVCNDGDACTTNDTCADGACQGGPAANCDDGNVCTGSFCDPDTGCSNPPNTASCEDGNACTINDKCSGGSCKPGGVKVCNDGNLCTDDSCNPATGCKVTPNTLPCDDANACTTADTCAGGSCVGGPAKDCDDGNPCKDDSCVPATGCKHTDNTAPCTDNDKCTTNDTCASGTCVGGVAPNCNDGNPCTNDTCLADTGCQNLNNTASCDDNDKCTSNDKCAGGACKGTQNPASNCDDGNPCTDDSCDPALGCKHTNNTAPCDDKDACTTNDTCDGAGGCKGGAPPQCDDGNVCTTDSCDSAGGCTNVNNTASCTDSNECTVGDKCAGGSCQAGTGALSCNDGNICTNDSCVPATGCKNANNTKPCNDSDACTTADTCNKGACKGGPPPNCDDGNPCTDDACDPATGCTHTPNTIPCDDGSECTTNDTCASSECKGTTKDCDDGNGCTDDGCNPATGCVYLDNTKPCDDKDACTTSDTCSGGVCMGGAPPQCDDGNVCTTDSCDKAGGCVNTNNTASCNDGNACTVGDKCQSGLCQPGATPLPCGDGNGCTDDSCDPASGCKHANNTASCNDNNACTTADKCSGGSCVGGPAPNCNDGNPCTNDSCLTTTGCQNTNNTATCDDNDKCTNNDKCSSGTCKGTTLPASACDDGNPCTNDSCDKALGCKHDNNTVACNDSDACTTTDKCSGGSCVGGAPPQCNDGNICTNDSCDKVGGCTNVNNTASCDDGNACTLGDKCGSGACKAGTTALSCNDNNLCTDDSCAPATGCKNANNTVTCDDGSACTTSDKCSGGACVGGAAPNCDDGNPCTDDSCDPATGCKHVANTASCNDGNACTSNDKCSNKSCGGTTISCDDGDVCTDDGCNTATGCVYTANTAPCSDGSLCTTNDKCAAKTCVGGPAPNCNDGNGCTDDSCVAATGCKHTNNTAGCNDGNACTTSDKCSGGSCVGGAAPNCNDGNPCTDDSCDSASGCKHANNTASCSDGNACTTSDKCSGGSCVGGAAPNCNDGNSCTDDSCDTASGCKNTNNTAGCNDGSACTTNDKCSGGSCVGGAAPNCNDGNPCTDDSCNTASGCQNLANTATCNDGNACTSNDKCANKACAGTTITCNDGNVCTDDSCNTSSGCVYTANTASCNDGNACTTNDKCSAKSCVGGAAPNCNDGNGCTTDSCNTSSGCVNANNTASCSDGNACTTNDTCSGGSCVGGAAPNCNDGNACTDDSCSTSSGCQHANNTTSCSDGNACTTNDKCSGGSCASGAALNCNDNNPCTSDSCSTTAGCQHSNISGSCNDNDVCTSNDTCVNGTCTGTPNGGGSSGGTPYSENFEGSAPGWTSGSLGGANGWKLTTTTFGSKAYGTPNDGELLGWEYSYLMSPTFNMSGGGTISFQSWGNNESNDPYDAESMQISYNGGSTWETLIPSTDSKWLTLKTWTTFTVSVPSNKGTSNTRVRFVYDTIDDCCGYSNPVGWYIDNFVATPGPTSSNYLETFESGAPGWTSGAFSGANGWKITTQNGGSSPSTFSSKVYGTPNDGDQLGYENSYLLSPALNTTGGATISFESWVNNESNNPYDAELVQISYNGGSSWETLVPTTDSKWLTLKQWVSFSLTVSSSKGSANTRVRFVYDTVDDCCGYGSQVGWFIDNFQVSGASGGSGCEDWNPCTDDVCDPTAGCVHIPNSASCDDGDSCTSNDKCSGGTCKGTPLPAGSGYTENFNGSAPGWTSGAFSGANGWKLASASGGTSPVTFSSKAYGTPNNGDQLGEEYSYLLSPVFNLSGGGTISFDSWVNNEDNDPYDAESVQISYNGGASWQTLVSSSDSKWLTHKQWITFTIPVPATSGTANTRVRFVYDTVDGCCGFSDAVGWFIDNFKALQGGGYSEDFQGTAPGWTTGTISGSVNGWKLTTVTGGTSPASLGSKAYGTPNNGSQLGMEHSYLMSPVFSSVGGASLTFKSWVNNEGSDLDWEFDLEIVQVSYNGGTSWSTLVSETNSKWDQMKQWVTFTLTLPSSAGTANTRIRFVYDTVDGCCGPSDQVGWFIDDFQVNGGGCQ